MIAGSACGGLIRDWRYIIPKVNACGISLFRLWYAWVARNRSKKCCKNKIFLVIFENFPCFGGFKESESLPDFYFGVIALVAYTENIKLRKAVN